MDLRGTPRLSKTPLTALIICLGAAAVFGLFLLKSQPPCSVGIWGTVHAQHVLRNTYPLDVLTSAVEQLRPSAIALEIPQKELNDGDWTSAPPEMALLYVQAQRLNIPVYGFDSEGGDDETPSPAQNPRLKKLRRQLIHSAEADRALTIYYRDRRGEIPESGREGRREDEAGSFRKAADGFEQGSFHPSSLLHAANRDLCHTPFR